MPRYSAFLLRCWRLDGDERRIKVEHIGSGYGTQVTTLDAALTWIEAHWTNANAAAAPDQTASVTEAARGKNGT